MLYLIVGKHGGDRGTACHSRRTTWSRWPRFGAFSGAFNNNAIRISQERKDGWIRQLRLTPLPANSYVVAKILASIAVTASAIVIMLLLGRFYGGVHLPIWEWIVIALAIWLGTLIFAALAVAIGYRIDPTRCSRSS